MRTRRLLQGKEPVDERSLALFGLDPPTDDDKGENPPPVDEPIGGGVADAEDDGGLSLGLDSVVLLVDGEGESESS